MSYTNFKKLHQQEELLVLGNVWDAQSASLAEESGFQALGTSSHAIANLLGYPDGEKISLDEMLFIIERIVKAVNIPVSVDFEAGYADDPEQVATNVGHLVDLGVVGINIEDGKVIKEGRQLQSVDLLQQKIQAIKAHHRNIFINARMDTYTTKHANALEESIKRASIYQDAGADGLFIPLAETESDIRSLVKACSLPINLFLTPKLPDVDKLSKLGIKRLSHGAQLYEWLSEQNQSIFKKFVKKPMVPKANA